MKKALVLSALLISACGSSPMPVPSNNPPDISGQYQCADNCLVQSGGGCSFPTLTDIQQNGSQVQSESNNSTTCTGSVNNNGDFNLNCTGPAKSLSGTCNGNFTNGVITANCNFGGNVCQEVTLMRE